MKLKLKAICIYNPTVVTIIAGYKIKKPKGYVYALRLTAYLACTKKIG